MSRSWAVRSLVCAALIAAVLTAAPSYAATIPGSPGSTVAALHSTIGTSVRATASGWSHTISGMATHLCGRSTPAMWATIAGDSHVSDPNRIGLGQLIVVRCATTSAAPAPPAPQSSPPVAPTAFRDSRIAKVLGYARAQLGKWYRFGSAGPNTFDCSGLVVASYRRIGIALPHQTAPLHSIGHYVARAQLRPGDIVFLAPQRGTHGHVAIYLGGGLVVEAPHTGARVRINRLYAFYGARRVL